MLTHNNYNCSAINQEFKMSFYNLQNKVIKFRLMAQQQLSDYVTTYTNEFPKIEKKFPNRFQR
uniref:Uncharacterized protein n=1 Tax=Rhizophora mucronata TaxID=61149 RepID=A0A2P2PAW8_RHIMU